MALPTTVAEYGSQLKTSLVGETKQEDAGERKIALESRDGALTRFAEGQQVVQTVTAEVAKYEKEAKDIRQQLAAIPTPADGPELIERLEATLSLMSTAQARLLAAQEELAGLKADTEVAQQRIDAIAAALSVAADLKKKGEELSKTRESLRAALGKEPLVSLKAAATAALAGQTFTEAKTRIEGDIPQLLLARARERRNLELTRQAQWADQLRKSQEARAQFASGGDGLAKLLQAEREFERVQEALTRYVTTGGEQFDRAMSLLKQIADRSQVVLTAEQKRRIEGKKPNGTVDAAVKTQREGALDQEKLLVQKSKEADEKEALYQNAVRKALADQKDPESEGAVRSARTASQTAQRAYLETLTAWRDKEGLLKQAVEETIKAEQAFAKQVKEAEAKGTVDHPSRAAVETARQKESTARRNYLESPLGVLHAWEGTIPDNVWQLLDQFEEAQRSLQVLESTVAADLELGWEKAETAYVKALVESDIGSNIRRRSEDEIARQMARVKAIEQSAVRRRFSAMRGD